MQRQHEAFAVAECREEERPDAIECGAGVSGSRRRVLYGDAKRAVYERREQVLAGWKVAVQGSDPDTGVLRDLRHRDLFAVTTYELGCGVEDPLAVAQRVTAGPA